jgi:hypothetical protein
MRLQFLRFQRTQRWSRHIYTITNGKTLTPRNKQWKFNFPSHFEIEVSQEEEDLSAFVLSTQKSKDTVQSKVIVIVESLDHDVTFEGYKQIVLDDIQENSQNLNNIEIKSETILGKQVYISTFQQKSGSGALLPTACVSYLHKGTSFNFQITDLGIGGTTLVEGLDLVKSILVTFSTN